MRDDHGQIVELFGVSPIYLYSISKLILHVHVFVTLAEDLHDIHT